MKRCFSRLAFRWRTEVGYLARALVHDPLLVLVDEPTGIQDDEIGRQVLMSLDHRTRQDGKNLILVTHSREVVKYVNCFLYLCDGMLKVYNRVIGGSVSLFSSPNDFASNGLL